MHFKILKFKGLSIPLQNCFILSTLLIGYRFFITRKQRTQICTSNIYRSCLMHNLLIIIDKFYVFLKIINLQVFFNLFFYIFIKHI